MKKNFLLICICLVGTLFAQNRQVSLLEAGKVADANAHALWGTNLYPAEPIPYYGPNDDIIAYHFNYSIAKPFPSDSELISNSGEALRTGKRELGWGVDEYANMVVGANRDMPVFIEYSKCLSPQYALGTKLEKAALNEFPGGYTLEKTYYLGLVDVWYCVASKGIKKYLNLVPKVMVKSEAEFRKYTGEKTYFWQSDTFEADWQTYLNNEETIRDIDDVWIPGEAVMPFYEWNLGCTPTAGAMLFAWWDHYSRCSNLIDYQMTNYDPVEDNYDHHVPRVQFVLANRMHTNDTGGTYVGDICDGLMDAAADMGYNCSSIGLWGSPHTVETYFNGIRTIIDGGQPLLVSIDSHTITGVGYNPSPAMVYTHDANWPVVHNITRSMLVGIYVANFELPSAFNWVEINSPNGGTEWRTNDGGETYYSGDYCGINWSGVTSQNTYVKLYYHDQDGSDPDRWFPITTNTPNDGEYDWIVPAIDYMGQNSTVYGRVKIEVYDSTTNALLATDGSYGNFTINPGGSLPQLIGAHTPVTQSPDYFSVDHYEDDIWGVISVCDLPTTGLNSWDIELFDSPDFSNLAVVSAGGTDNLNYIVIDNHTVAPNEWGVKFRADANNEVAKAQFFADTSQSILTNTTYYLGWNTAYMVAKVFSIDLIEGEYCFELDNGDAGADVDIALFKSGGDGIFFPGDAIVASTNMGAGVDESFQYTVSALDAGNYGLCVSSRSRGYFPPGYTLRVSTAGKWLGAVSTDWFDPANWIGGMVPTFETNVIIPVSPNYPHIVGGAANPAYVKTLTIESLAYLYLGDAYLIVYGDMQVFGRLDLQNDNAVVDVAGSVVWEPGSSVMMFDDSTIYCTNNWTFKAGSNALFIRGTVELISATNSYIECDSSNSRFHILKINKAAGASVTLSENSSTNMVVGGALRIESGALLQSNSNRTIIINEAFQNFGNFRLDSGTMKFTTNTASLGCGATDYFYNLDISTTFATTLTTDLRLKGDLNINSGGIIADDRTIYIGGSWHNNMGFTGFDKGISTVIFNGEGQVECSGEHFYTLEIANSLCELHFDSGISSSVFYNWTAGTLYIDGGILSVLQLMDNGITGRTFVNSGTLNLTQTSAANVNLNGELHISGGTMNVNGGSGDSYWPGNAHAWLEMSGGFLDFKDVGIRINYTPTYLLTADITGGTIRTSGNFKCYRIDFLPEDGVIEMYGTGDAILYCENQSQLANLFINKTSARSNDAGSDALLETTRANTVTLSSNIKVVGDLVVSTGTFNLASYTMNISHAVEISSNLIMTNAANIITIGQNLYWYRTATGQLTSGEIQLNGNLYIVAGASFTAGVGSTLRFIGTLNSTISNLGTAHTLGNIILDKTSGTVTNADSPMPITILGNLTLNGNNSLYLGYDTVTVNGNLIANTGSYLELTEACTLIVAGNTTANGEFLIGDAYLYCHTDFQQGTSGVLTLQTGSCLLDRAYTGTTASFAGTVIINGGVLEVTNNAIQFGIASSFTMSSGILRVGWGFTANYANIFHPTGGTVEFIGARVGSIQFGTGNYFHNLLINKPGSSYSVSIISDVTITNDFTLQAGVVIEGQYDISIGRDLIINGGTLNASNASAIISVGRNWDNNVGINAFTEGSGTVNFVSAQTAVISSETFNIVYIDKTATTNNIITLESGATMTVNGWLHLIFGCLQLGTSSIVDANNNITISDGAALNISSATGNNILYLAGHLYDQNVISDASTGFYTGSNSTLVLNGSADQLLSVGYSNNRMYLGHVTVNKSAGSVKHNKQMNFQGNVTITSGTWSYAVSGLNKSFSRDLIIEAGGSFIDPTASVSFSSTNNANLKVLGTAQFGGISFNKGSTASVVTMTGNVTFGGTDTWNLTSGTINLNGHTLTYSGAINLASLGKINLTASSVLNLGNGAILTIGSGGQFVSLGTEISPALLTCSSGYYGFTANSGATLGAEYTTFEKMNSSGINLVSGSLLDAGHSFTGCKFQNGVAGGSLLQINCQQNISIQGANFPANTWSGTYNVYRNQSAGSVTFINYSGAFSGSAFEFDPNSNVIWDTMASLGTPQNVTLSIIEGVAHLTWDPVPGAAYYFIYRSFVPDILSPGDYFDSSYEPCYDDATVYLNQKAFYLIRAYAD